ncbi:MAG: cytochrome P450 [Myxococcota bacterium]
MSSFTWVEPTPPCVDSWVPRWGCGPALLRDPAAFFRRSRARLGDTFALEPFGYPLLCVFSPEGIRGLWALPEKVASKGAADFALLRHKVPDELFAGRRTFPHGLFARDDVDAYRRNLEGAVGLQLEELRGGGDFEAFAWARRLGHRVGLASWAGAEAASPRYLDRLVPLLDRLDSSESFVHPERAFWTIATGKRAERRALGELDAILGELAARADANPDGPDDLFARIRAAWSDVEGPERLQGIARDVVLVHMGSQSNLFAALAWTLVHLLERPALLERVREGDDALLERCAHESIRLRQRSMILRQVLRPAELFDGRHTYQLKLGAFVATVLSVTNDSVLSGLEHFDPDHYAGRRFTRADELEATESVTTFGFGAHSCPAQGFAILAIRHAVGELLRRFELEPRFSEPKPLRRQLGGVARADRPCRVAYRLRSDAASRTR